ncbi:hypothetical protein M8I34_34515 [Streptomyces sp. MCA2]|uniref:hypothetical protein n=1 Tax=Streptomyces sp. MCA2 TaxID=2944805 RepID=UPI002020F5FB|nr:hypothetical protein [Streptomyces sp. MCA2]MCL7496483.1 hypothetical protein [Streptomyces sp. MCA2]
MTTNPPIGLTRPVRGVKVHSRQTLGACAPTYGRVELDFEPLPAGVDSSITFACTASPERAPEYEESLAVGVMRELAATDAAEDPEARRGAPVKARARVIVRAMSWHWVDTCEMVFVRLGALAVREALCCVAEDREPHLVETRVSLSS